jgi:putative Holliday junction resolvase
MRVLEARMRVLAIDPGTVRCGLAVSDGLGMLATPVGVVPVGDGRDLAVALARRAAELGAVRILVGLPLHADGTESFRSRAATRLADALRQATPLPVELVDERLTSVEAEDRLAQAGKRGRDAKAHRDAAAAAVLLQWWLDARRDGPSVPPDPSADEARP